MKWEDTFFFSRKGGWGGSRVLEVYLLQVFSVKGRVSQKRGGSEGSERLARFSLSGVQGCCENRNRPRFMGLKLQSGSLNVSQN